MTFTNSVAIRPSYVYLEANRDLDPLLSMFKIPFLNPREENRLAFFFYTF